MIAVWVGEGWSTEKPRLKLKKVEVVSKAYGFFSTESVCCGLEFLFIFPFPVLSFPFLSIPFLSCLFSFVFIFPSQLGKPSMRVCLRRDVCVVCARLESFALFKHRVCPKCDLNDCW